MVLADQPSFGEPMTERHAVREKIRSMSRGGSTVREMVACTSQSNDEMRMFEMKFKGSLDKLDEFEKDWANFKSAAGI